MCSAASVKTYQLWSWGFEKRVFWKAHCSEHTLTHTHTYTLQPELTLTPTTTRCLFNDCGGAPLPLKIRQRKKNNIYHFQLPLPLKDTIFTHSLPSSSVGLVCLLCHGDWTLFPNCKMYHCYQHPGKIYKLNCGFHLLPKFWACLEIQINAINPFFFKNFFCYHFSLMLLNIK